MPSLIISTIVFFVAGWYFNRYLDGQEIPKGMTRGMLVFTLVALVAYGSAALVGWAQIKIEGPQAASQTPDRFRMLKEAGQARP
jgi:hypothetical protein